MIRPKQLVAVVTVALLLSGCAEQPQDAPASSPSRSPAASPASSPTTTPASTAWAHLATVTGRLEDSAAAAAVQDRESLRQTWRRYGFQGRPPQVDFDQRFVLLVLQPDDACPDELIRLDVVDAVLRVEWLAPPGGCRLPLIYRVHAVEVHRGHVPRTFTVTLEEPYAADAKPTPISLQPYDGQPAPLPPDPPKAMTEAEVDAVFAGHPVRRCTPQDDVVPPLPPGTVVDERNEGAEEAQMQRVMEWLQEEGWELNGDVVPIMDRSDNLRPHLRVNADHAQQLQREVDVEFGEAAVVVDANRYRMEEISAAQNALVPLMGREGPGRIWASSGTPGPVKLSMVDPTRAVLDEIAATVDPSLVCVEVEVSGVRR